MADIVGQLVQVDFASGERFNGRVMYKPVATGDCWHIEDREGYMHYVQNFEQITEMPETLEPEVRRG